MATKEGKTKTKEKKAKEKKSKEKKAKEAKPDYDPDSSDGEPMNESPSIDDIKDNRFYNYKKKQKADLVEKTSEIDGHLWKKEMKKKNKQKPQCTFKAETTGNRCPHYVFFSRKDGKHIGDLCPRHRRYVVEKEKNKKKKEAEAKRRRKDSSSESSSDESSSNESSSNDSSSSEENNKNDKKTNSKMMPPPPPPKPAKLCEFLDSTFVKKKSDGDVKLESNGPSPTVMALQEKMDIVFGKKKDPRPDSRVLNEEEVERTRRELEKWEKEQETQNKILKLEEEKENMKQYFEDKIQTIEAKFEDEKKNLMEEFEKKMLAILQAQMKKDEQ